MKKFLKFLVVQRAVIFFLLLMVFLFILSKNEAHAEELKLFSQESSNTYTTLSNTNPNQEVFYLEIPTITSTSTLSKIVVKGENFVSDYMPMMYLCRDTSDVFSTSTPQSYFDCSYMTPVHDWDGTDWTYDSFTKLYTFIEANHHNYSGDQLYPGHKYYLQIKQNSSGTTKVYLNNISSFTTFSYKQKFNNYPSYQITDTGGLPYYQFWINISTDVGNRIDLVYPVANTQQEVRVDVPIPLYTTFTAYGYCLTDGQDRIYVHTQPNSYFPTSTDFTNQGIDCVGGQWSYNISSVSEGLNTFTFWAKDFLDDNRIPIYDFDYTISDVYFYNIMSFDPGQFSTSVPTSTPTSLWLNFSFSSVPVIGGFIQDKIDYLKSRFPWGYLDDIWTIWKNSSASTQTSLSVDVPITPSEGAPATSTLSLVLLPNIQSGIPWYGSAYSTQLNGLEAKLTPWIWIGWGWFYLGIIFRLFKKKINHDNN